MSTDVYCPLRLDRKEIRLVTIVAGKFQEDIKLLLTLTDLADKPDFQALSYSWGDLNVTKCISLDGQPFHITTNLEAALRRFRQPTKNLVYWIDAICVNQSDIPERNSQVRLMTEIYTSCHGCVIWFGEEDEETAAVVSAIDFLATDEHLDKWDIFSDIPRVDGTCKLDITALRQYCLDHEDILAPLKHFMHRSWWSRTWIIQEFVLAKAKILVCGHRYLLWNTMLAALSSLGRHKFCCNAIYQATSEPMQQALDVFHGRVTSLQWFAYHHSTDEVSLIDLLVQVFFQSSTDPRDKVYALLGLVTLDPVDAIQPRYHVDTATVYTEAVRYHLNLSQSLEILGHSLEKNPMASTLSLPTWVPDWSMEPSMWEAQNSRYSRYKLFDASNGKRFQGGILGDKILQLTGISHDAISHAGPSGHNLSRFTAEDVAQHLKQITTWLKVTVKAEHLTFRVIIRTLMNDCHSLANTKRRGQPDDYPSWADAITQLTQGPEMRAKDPAKIKLRDSILADIWTSIVQRRFFWTATGRLGLGPPGLEIGDEIWIAAGGNMPLVLRQADGIHAGRPCHSFVGDAYVDGVMDGEAAYDFEARAIDVFLV